MEQAVNTFNPRKQSGLYLIDNMKVGDVRYFPIEKKGTIRFNCSKVKSYRPGKNFKTELTEKRIRVIRTA